MIGLVWMLNFQMELILHRHTIYRDMSIHLIARVGTSRHGRQRETNVSGPDPQPAEAPQENVHPETLAR